MKMADIRVGMRLESEKHRPFSPITVTELTERGFKYSLDAAVPGWPRAGQSADKDNHEHYGYDGLTDYEVLPAHVEAARDLISALCSDPEIWATHGCPNEHKLALIERAISGAILTAMTDCE